ncbi:hypothetical protein ACFSKI_15255 [Pseudogracilibacillus auburnensis]|uniref:Uncharacterized protein n=1 Tax=Pseudogracilibacillus auburnensis TaxID=1494959 RepID=A0A2V3VR74_9BACI|nr:hypothetical protein [Pseudogracilibacillus auburnensis]PXW82505.1 hypothetical protein DFR56_11882 [Pseudogracilibacillus auburnensis]
MMYFEEDKIKRIHLSNPSINTPLSKRLIKNNSIDLRNNSYTIDHGNGYDEIKPIDPNKLIKAHIKR